MMRIIIATLAICVMLSGATHAQLLGVNPDGSRSQQVPPKQRQWFVHCKELNPVRGCGCVNHATNSYNPTLHAPWIQWGPGTWTGCGNWMRAHGFPGW